MLEITIITIGKRLASPFEELGREYTKRLGEKPRLVWSWQKDEKGLFEAARSHPHPIFLEERGKQIDSKSFAKELESLGRIAFVIGPAEGFSREVKGWSLSALTFPHQFVICLLLEQIYRAKTIIEGHPYHK